MTAQKIMFIDTPLLMSLVSYNDWHNSWCNIPYLRINLRLYSKKVVISSLLKFDTNYMPKIDPLYTRKELH